MIFLCCGSRGYQFDRLVKKVDDLCEKKIITEEVFGQIGDSRYKPKNFKWERYISKKEFEDYQDIADLIISHAGTGALISALKKNKRVIAVPRLKQFDEHIDDHQLQIAEVLTREGYLLQVIDIEKLEDAVLDMQASISLKQFSIESKLKETIDSYLERL